MTDWFADLRPFEAAYAAWRRGDYAIEARFLLSYEEETPFAIAAGAGLLVHEMRRFKLNEPATVQRLAAPRSPDGRMAFDESFLNHLQRHRFRGRLLAAAEGTVLLPGEPVLIVEAGLLDGLLLKYILDTTVWQSTHCATEAALAVWRSGQFFDKKAAAEPAFSDDLDGWKSRARFIGGGEAGAVNDHLSTRESLGYQLASPENPAAGRRGGLAQIRRCFQSGEPVADLFLTDEQEEKLPGGLRSHEFMNDGKKQSVKFTRFSNLYQPVLLDGHTAFASPKLSYLRQRALRQMEAFHDKGLERIPTGWLC